MPTVTAQSITEAAAKTLLDDSGVRWTPNELFGYVGAGEREICILKPEAYTKRGPVDCVPGTVQSLPTDASGLMEITRNMGADGLTPGGAIRQMDRTVMDSLDPGWHNHTPGPAKHFIYDDRDPLRFSLYPPQPDPAEKVEAVYPATPPAIAAMTDPINLPDVYEPALYYFVLFRALSKDSGTANPGKAGQYYGMMVQLVTGRTNAQQMMNPEQMAERAKR